MEDREGLDLILVEGVRRKYTIWMCYQLLLLFSKVGGIMGEGIVDGMMGVEGVGFL